MTRGFVKVLLFLDAGKVDEEKSTVVLVYEEMGEHLDLQNTYIHKDSGCSENRL